MLQDFLMTIFYSREDVTSRDVQLITGTGGAHMFHNAVANMANGFLTVDTHWVRPAEGVGSTPGLSYGSQFTRYNGPSGLQITVVQNPFYDDSKYCKRVHPQYPMYPIDSFRMSFLDFGTNRDGQRNIQMLRLKDSYTEGYTQGMWG